MKSSLTPTMTMWPMTGKGVSLGGAKDSKQSDLTLHVHAQVLEHACISGTQEPEVGGSQAPGQSRQKVRPCLKNPKEKKIQIFLPGVKENILKGGGIPMYLSTLGIMSMRPWPKLCGTHLLQGGPEG